MTLDIGYVDGDTVTAQQLRHDMWAATRGGRGVATMGSLKVSALAVPAGQVKIGAGSVVIPTGFVDADAEQSYRIGSTGETVNVPPNSTGVPGKYEVWAVANDPQFAGQPTTPVPPRILVLGPVAAAATITLPADTLGVSYKLATLTLPASTGTVTDAMITDNRVLADPRSKRVLLSYSPPAGPDEVMPSAWGQWPNYAPQVPVPSWASKAFMTATFQGVTYTGASGVTSGAVRCAMGATPSADPISWSFESATRTKVGLMSSGSWTVPLNLRGTSVPFTVQGWKAGGTGSVLADHWAYAVYDLWFEESI